MAEEGIPITRITVHPAEVGNAVLKYPLVAVMAVHPHGRGERRAARPRLDHTTRFIPTDVGNACKSGVLVLVKTVHPHGRGERGEGRITQGRVDRFIPTGVGNARRKVGCRQAPPVHPHGRGERAPSSIQIRQGRGSSPRAWGMPAHKTPIPAAGRFIPTGVGNASGSNRHQQGATVHPHGRGERVSARVSRLAASGSSPRTWGTPPGFHHRGGQFRFIPTDVGNA